MGVTYINPSTTALPVGIQQATGTNFLNNQVTYSGPTAQTQQPVYSSYYRPDPYYPTLPQKPYTAPTVTRQPTNVNFLTRNNNPVQMGPSTSTGSYVSTSPVQALSQYHTGVIQNLPQQSVNFLTRNNQQTGVMGPQPTVSQKPRIMLDGMGGVGYDYLPEAVYKPELQSIQQAFQQLRTQQPQQNNVSQQLFDALNRAQQQPTQIQSQTQFQTQQKPAQPQQMTEVQRRAQGLQDLLRRQAEYKAKLRAMFPSWKN